MVLLPKDHHLCVLNNYGYLHRVIAERKLQRPLTEEEVVSFMDGDTMNCSEDNIVIFPTIQHLRVHYRRVKRSKDKRLKLPDEDNNIIECRCGCGASFTRFDKSGRPRMFVPGHNSYSKSPGL